MKMLRPYDKTYFSMITNNILFYFNYTTHVLSCQAKNAIDKEIIFSYPLIVEKQDFPYAMS
jgi:hypothetical protein